MRIYVHYFARGVTADDLKGAFAAYGQVSEAGILRVPPNDDPLGVGYVEMTRDQDVSAALGGIEEITIGGFPIRLDEPRCGVGRRTGIDRRGESNTRGPDRRLASRRLRPRQAA